MSVLRMHGRLLAMLASMALLMGAYGIAAPTTAHADTVTFAARVCDDYSDIMANRARNNLQQSLEDLGPNSTYKDGDTVRPGKENAVAPDFIPVGCKPIVGWRFTMGSAGGHPIEGPWGVLTGVGSPFNTFIETQASTPELSLTGSPIGRDVKGAVTITLTAAQAKLAEKQASLRVMGGTSTDPLMQQDPRFAGSYAFGTLRCGIDNQNADNLEWIAYNNGTNHTFCIAYYVAQARTAGTITITKKTVNAPGTAATTFTFDGSVSYDASGTFQLAPPANQSASMSFERAATTGTDTPWRVGEIVPAGWQIASITCASSTGGSSFTQVDARSIDIRLGAADDMNCTYVDQPTTSDSLIITKRTIGGTGSFPITVTAPGGSTTSKTITTSGPTNAGSFITGFTQAGTYTITETVPDSDRGTWVAQGVTCQGTKTALRKQRRRLRSTDYQFTVQVTQPSTTCVVTNAFVPAGSITINGVAWNGTVRKAFEVTSMDGTPPIKYSQVAVLDQEGVPEQAVGGGVLPTRLPLRTYSIQELEPFTSAGDWALVDITCTDGAIVERVIGGVIVRLTEDTPDVECAFTNRLDVKPGPDPDPAPSPTPTPDDPSGDGTSTNSGDPSRGAGPRTSGVLPVAGVATGFGGNSVPAPFRLGSPWHRLLQADPAASTNLPRYSLGARRTSHARASRLSLRIPDLGVLAHVQTVDLTRDHLMRVPADPTRVGWWSGSSVPGGRGATVLVGHVDGPAGPAVFNRLSQLDRGDRIQLKQGTTKYRYRVVAVRTYAKTAVPRSAYRSSSSRNVLRLITCGGSFNSATGHYRSNVVVYAVRVR